MLNTEYLYTGWIIVHFCPLTCGRMTNRQYGSFHMAVVPKNLNYNIKKINKFIYVNRKFNWTYVSVVHSDNEYGLQGYETLSTLAGKYNVCFSAPQRVDKEHFQDRDYDHVLDNIVNKTEVRGEYKKTYYDSLNAYKSHKITV